MWVVEQETSVESWIQGRYRVMHSLGAGGLGYVFYGWDEELHRPVAIKRLFSRPDAASPALEEAWREARALAALQNPHILTLFDFGSDGQGPYFIMEYLEGETLEQVLERGAISLNDAVEMARQTLEGLSAAHERGVCHLDLKPSNLMIQRTPSGKLHVKILDFGLARFQQQIDARRAEEAGAAGVMGTVYYISPEHMESGVLGGYTDLYALGHVLYQSLRGTTAFVGASVEEVVACHLQSQPEPIRGFRPDVSPPLAAWLERMMMRNPADRPADAKEALLELRKLDAFNLTSSRPVFALSVDRPVEKGFGWGKAGAIAAVLLLGGGAFAWWWTREPALPATVSPVAVEIQKPQVEVSTFKPASQPEPERASQPAPEPVLKPEPEFKPAPAGDSAGPEFYAPGDLVELREQIGREVVVRGVPLLAGKNRDDRVRYLNFSEDYAQSVSLVFFVEDQPEDFALEKLDGFVGKALEVRGTVQEYRGALQIRIRRLDQLRLTGS